MKQIPLLQNKALLIELPEGAPTPYVINTGRPHLSYLDIDIDLPEVDLPPGNWLIIGMLSEVTEEQAHWWVDYTGKTDPIAGGLHMWANYVTGGDVYSALESLESAIISEGYVFSNPYGDTKPSGIEDSLRWMTAQSRVLDRSRCLLLGEV